MHTAHSTSWSPACSSCQVRGPWCGPCCTLSWVTHCTKGAPWLGNSLSLPCARQSEPVKVKHVGKLTISFCKANYSYLKWGWRWPEWVSLMPAVGWGRWGTGYGGSWLSLHEAQLLRQPLVPRPSSWGRGTYFRAAGMVKVLRITGFRIGHLLVAGASRSDPRHTLWHWFTNLLNLALSSVIDVLGR